MKWKAVLMMVLAFTLLTGASALAFNDVKGDPAERSILALKKAGIVNGVDAHHFHPKGVVTYAEAVHLLVKGLHLGKDIVVPPKQKASDLFPNVSDDSWYANSFIIAHERGLPIPKEVNPTQQVTREQFADLLMKAVLTTGDYAFIELYVIIDDEDDINPDYMNSIQKLLVSNIVKLDDQQKFYPKKALTRSQAAQWLHQAMNFIKKMNQPPHNLPDQPDPAEDVSLQVEKVNDEVNKATLSWGEKPTAGYAITVTSIEFTEDKEAIIHYRLTYPEPDSMQAQVITYPQAVTYISSEYKAVLYDEKSSPANPGRGQGIPPFPGKGSAIDPDTPVSSPAIEKQ